MGAMCIKLKVCQKGATSKGSSDSIDSKGSQYRFHALVNTCREGIYYVDEPKVPRKTEIERPKFASSVFVFFNNSRLDSNSTPYNFAMEKNPEVYFRFFPYLRIKENEGVFTLEREKYCAADTARSKEHLESIRKSEEFQKHLRLTNKVVNSVLGLAVSDDMSSVEGSLKRIGARHAELGINAKHILAFKESFMNWLEDLLDPDKEVFRTWMVFIKYVVHMIIRGMNDHYTKVMFVYWTYHPQKKLNCFTPSLRSKPVGVDAEALLSLRNMAAIIDASDDD